MENRLDRLPCKAVDGRRTPVAATRASRLLGLTLLQRERAGDGLLIPRCSSVHTFGMRFELDLLWLDSAGRAIRLDQRVGPGRVRRCRGAEAVLEMPSRAGRPRTDP